MQVHSKILVVETDIGKDTHYARAFDFLGIEIGKLLKFKSSAQAYTALDNWMAYILEIGSMISIRNTSKKRE